MAQGFNVGLKTQQEWGWLLAAWFFLSGTGSALFLFSEAFGLPVIFALLSLVLVVIGGALLLLGLGNPLRAWRGISRPASSWLSRGAVSVAVFLLCGALSIAPAFGFTLAWNGASTAATALGWIAALFALIITLYPGFFLASNRSVPFWNTPLVPAVTFGFALMGGSAVALAGSAFLGEALQGIDTLATFLVVINLVMLALLLHAAKRAGVAAAESLRLLNRAPLAWVFWIGAVLIGMVVPLLALLWLPSARVPAGVCMLVGCFVFRYCLLKAGVYVPAPVPDVPELGRFTPTSADLRREYAGRPTESLSSGG